MILGTANVPYDFFLYPIGFGTALLLLEEMVFISSVKSNISENTSVDTLRSPSLLVTHGDILVKAVSSNFMLSAIGRQRRR